MSLSIRYLEVNNEFQEMSWDHFVRSSPHGTVFHLCAWRRVIEQVFLHSPHYLVAHEGDEIRGVLPLFEIHGLLAGHVLVSVPYGVYGGLCCTDPEAREALLAESRRLGARRKVRHIELRQLFVPHHTLLTKSTYVSFRRFISSDPETNLAAIPGKQRRWVRKGMKNGLEAHLGWEHLKEFYDVYAMNMCRLGSPVFPRSVFEAIRDQFGKEAELLTVWHNGRVVGGVQSFFFNDRVMPYYAAASQEAFSMGVNDFMYWELMRQAGQNGYRIFDFSRSRKGSGSYDFKCHWGFEPEPLAYQYVLINGQCIPNISPSNPRLKIFIETWKRLPIGLTKWLGPILTRRLPLD